MHFIAARPNHEKVIDSLKFLQLSSEYTPDSHYDTYIDAFDYVQATLRDTVDVYAGRCAAAAY